MARALYGNSSADVLVRLVELRPGTSALAVLAGAPLDVRRFDTKAPVTDVVAPPGYDGAAFPPGQVRSAVDGTIAFLGPDDLVVPLEVRAAGVPGSTAGAWVLLAGQPAGAAADMEVLRAYVDQRVTDAALGDVDLSRFATREQVQDDIDRVVGALPSAPDLSGYARAVDVTALQATMEVFTNRVRVLEALVAGGQVPTVPDPSRPVATFTAPSAGATLEGVATVRGTFTGAGSHDVVIVEPPTAGTEDTNVPLVTLPSSYEAWDAAGVNMHLGYTSTEGFDNDRYVENALDSGFGWFRDQITTDKGATHRSLVRHRAIADAGGRWAMVAGHPRNAAQAPRGRWLVEAWPVIVDAFGGHVDRLMGPNEFLGGSATDTDRALLRDYMREIAAALEARPEPLAAQLRTDLWSPSQAFASRQTAYNSAFRDGVTSRGDMHSYSGGVSPVGANGAGSFWSWKTAALGAVPGAAPVATETGYHSAWRGNGIDSIDGGTIGHVPTNSDGYRILAPRLLFDYLREGVHKVFYYQLRDQTTETALVDRELHFGLYTAAGAIKPEGQAMRRMLLRLKDTPRAAMTTRLAVGGAGVTHWASARSDGAIDLALWQRKDATRYSGPGQIVLLDVPTVAATVRFGRRVRLSTYYPSDLTSGVIDLGVVEAGATKTVQVPHHVLMLRATPA